ncbi:MAG: hypothetical protein KKB81_07645 [Candidatus Margulisbacteria bacterium]|nr:hypothetical protein [Candidatus Margulisiibacteriota bacterium]MBU1021221.1 hypothetical protein [Candidatus Margulisiibacteriota bacterium]MBU1729827.1 hypothetical protein [Candidatus Margulisiibacteriota bacterium]MBU1955328.1 hypothetical protein [Candidatus Margulisiibacteriota bacterium]
MKKNNFAKASKGYSYTIDRKRLLEFAKFSIEDRLQWLEEANEFLNKVASPETKKMWQLFREGKI